MSGKTDLLPYPVFDDMGSRATPPDGPESSDEADQTPVELGDLLSGRLAEIDVNSVEVVREERERR